MLRITKAAKHAEQWLQSIQSSNSEIRNLRDMGLMFCETIFTQNDTLKSLRTTESSYDYPKGFPLSLLQMERNDILSLAMNMSFSKSKFKLSSKQQKEWAQIIGGISLSYARYGDVPVVAALVRIAKLLEFDNSLLVDAHSFLMDQQEPDGTFGTFRKGMESMQ
ncbi:hypothetical protein [Peribacillus frigoritolerans]|uniref:hypothetical protein n=1 Tax=Peribacillus frigoritolerans TaxID=450367 RepID=UPI003B8AD085